MYEGNVWLSSPLGQSNHLRHYTDSHTPNITHAEIFHYWFNGVSQFCRPKKEQHRFCYNYSRIINLFVWKCHWLMSKISVFCEKDICILWERYRHFVSKISVYYEKDIGILWEWHYVCIFVGMLLFFANVMPKKR